MGSVAKMTKPYRAAMQGMWVEVKNFYEEHIELLHVPLTVNGDTALHIAVYVGNMKLLKALLDIIVKWEMELSMFYKSALFRVKDNHGQTALHLAAANGNLEAVKLLLEYDEELFTVKNNREETPLFLAASFGQTKVVKYLSSRFKDKKTHVKRNDKTTILHVAILGEYFDTALELLSWDVVSPEDVDENGATCFQLLAIMPAAFKSGYRMSKFKTLLYCCLPDVDYAENYDKESDSKSEVTATRNKGDLETGNKRETDQQPSNQQTANSLSGLSKAYNTFWRCIARAFPTIQKVWTEKKKHNKALEVAKILARIDFSWLHTHGGGAPSQDEVDSLSDITHSKSGGGAPSQDEADSLSDITHSKSGGDKIVTSKEDKVNVKEEEDDAPPTTIQTSLPYETPFIAAGINGILEIVKAILEVYPQAIEHVNEQNENIFHVVARHHRANILDYLRSSSNVPISRLRTKINTKNGNSILHNAAYLSSSSSRDRPGEALLMQSDLQWFERIEKIVPKYFINHRNNENWTAQELFTVQHKQLHRNGQEWLGRTAEACTLVAVLIATVAFTCAYTVPGGSTDTGRPLLLKETPFSVFAASDALSLCLSLTSVVLFLSIMTSKMNEQDFRWSLPLKLVSGLTTLFLSVTFMMIAFSATLLLIVRQRLHWAAIPIYTVACIPVTIFLLLQLPLYLNISTFTLKDLFAAK